MKTSSHAGAAKDRPHSAQKIPTQDRKCQHTHVLDLLIPKRDHPQFPDDMPSFHRSKETVREEPRKGRKVNEDIAHKPKGVPTPLSRYKHH